jgi:predicted ester cyclase
VVEGKIVESWVEVDMLGVMQQLGAVPEPGQS